MDTLKIYEYMERMDFLIKNQPVMKEEPPTIGATSAEQRVRSPTASSILWKG